MNNFIIPIRDGGIPYYPGEGDTVHTPPDFVNVPSMDTGLDYAFIFDLIADDENKVLSVEESQQLVLTFYCDSIYRVDPEIIENTDGDGSSNNPWRDVNYALQQLTCTLEKSCCILLQLKIKGNINYTIEWAPNRVILDKWGENNFIIENYGNGSFVAFQYGSPRVYNCDIVFLTESDSNSYFYAFQEPNGVCLYNVNISYSNNASSSRGGSCYIIDTIQGSQYPFMIYKCNFLLETENSPSIETRVFYVQPLSGLTKRILIEDCNITLLNIFGYLWFVSDVSASIYNYFSNSEVTCTTELFPQIYASRLVITGSVFTHTSNIDLTDNPYISITRDRIYLGDSFIINSQITSTYTYSTLTTSTPGTLYPSITDEFIRIFDASFLSIDLSTISVSYVFNGNARCVLNAIAHPDAGSGQPRGTLYISSSTLSASVLEINGSAFYKLSACPIRFGDSYFDIVDSTLSDSTCISNPYAYYACDYYCFGELING